MGAWRGPLLPLGVRGGYLTSSAVGVSTMPSDAWSFYESHGAHGRSTLTSRQQAVLPICDLRQGVNAADLVNAYLAADS